MTERHDAARAALEAALAATSGGPTTPSGGPGATPRRPQSRPAGESDPYDIARQIVLRQLALAPKTRKQLEDKLRQRDCPDDVARVVLDRMAAVGLVDDEAYAGMLVRSQQVGRGLAKRALARELRTKGVDDQIARATLDAIDPEDERERARQLVAKRLRTMHGLDPVVQTRRLAGMLARKGYPPDVSMTVIREAVANAPEHQRD
jgi:regulatory protein